MKYAAWQASVQPRQCTRPCITHLQATRPGKLWRPRTSTPGKLLRQPVRAGSAVKGSVLDQPTDELRPQESNACCGAGKHAVVVGAGPAGAVTAMLLAKRGFTVDVFEQRPRPASSEQEPGKTYLMILNGRCASHSASPAFAVDPSSKVLPFCECCVSQQMALPR